MVTINAEQNPSPHAAKNQQTLKSDFPLCKPSKYKPNVLCIGLGKHCQKKSCIFMIPE